MKAVTYLLPILATTAILAFGVLASDKNLPPANQPVAVSDAKSDPSLVASRPSKMREILDENPELVHWLVEVTATQGDERSYQAISALAPIATAELIKELDNKNLQARMIAMFCLSECVTSPDFPHKELLGKLLRIAQNEEEDEKVRKLATVTICRVVCAIQGAPLPSAQE